MPWTPADAFIAEKTHRHFVRADGEGADLVDIGGIRRELRGEVRRQHRHDQTHFHRRQTVANSDTIGSSGGGISNSRFMMKTMIMRAFSPRHLVHSG